MDLTPQEKEEFEFRDRYESEMGQSGPQWSDLPHNAMEGLKEAPQTAAGLATMGKAGMDLTSPSAYLKSGMDALTGTPIGETDIGKAGSMVQAGLGHTVDTIKKLPGNIAEFAQHPGQSIKNHVIEHPISSAVDAASILMPGLKATGAAETMGKYAGRFGEDAMGKLHGAKPGTFNKITGERFGDAMRSSYEMGDADLTLGPLGREQMIKERIEGLGQKTGENRALARSMGPDMTPNEMADLLDTQLKGNYGPGGEQFDQASALQREIANIRAMPEGGIENFAQRASAIKHNAQTNVLSNLPSGAQTDVANTMSHINDAEIAKRLPKELNEDYLLSNSEFGKAKSLKGIQAKSEGFERLGSGSNTSYGDIKKVAAKTVFSPKMKAHGWFGAESAMNQISKNGGALAVGGMTAHLVNTLSTDPQSLGKYAAPLLKAAQEGGNQALAATHYLLSTQYPDYNELMSGK